MIKLNNFIIYFSFVDMVDSGGSRNSKGWRRVGRHYLLLLWKNLILAKRMPVRTFLEITLPVFFGFLLLGIRHIVKSETFSNSTVFPSFPIDKLPTFDLVPISMLAYAPKTDFTEEVMNRTASSLGLYGKWIEEIFI